MTTFSVGIVGHVERIEMAQGLKEATGGILNLDNGTLRCLGNHAYVQRELVANDGWSVVLEDDALLLNDFLGDLGQVLEIAEQKLPEDVKVVSLYLGTGYPNNWQRRITPALEAETSFILCPELLHAVGYAVAPDIKSELASWMQGSQHIRNGAPDYLMSIWLAAHQYRVAYTNPSLVDHRDVRTVIRARGNTFAPGRNRPRKAHNTRQRLTWGDSYTTMDRHGNH